MLFEYIKKVLEKATVGAEAGSTMIEMILCLTIFFLPKFFENPKRDLENEKSTRKILFYKIRFHTEWRIGIVICLFFLLHFCIVAPFCLYEETKIKLDALTTEESIQSHRAILEPVVVIDFNSKEGVIFHYEVENIGKTVANDIRWSTSGAEFDELVSTNFYSKKLEPAGKMRISSDVPASVSKSGFHSELTLFYNNHAGGSNLSFQSSHRFNISPQLIREAARFSPSTTYVNTNSDYAITVNQKTGQMTSWLDRNDGTISFWMTESNVQKGTLLSGTNKYFKIYANSRMAEFVVNDDKGITHVIRKKINSEHFFVLHWDATRAGMNIDLSDTTYSNPAPTTAQDPRNED